MKKKIHNHSSHKDKVSIKVRGRFKNLLYKMLAKIKSRHPDITEIEVVDSPNGYVEIFAIGKKEILWEVVEWATKGNVYFVVDNVTFKFSEVA